MINYQPEILTNDKGPRLIQKNDGLVASNIGKRFKMRPVLRNVSVSVQRGEAVGLLGPNGAGKTTCFYVMIGLMPPNYGSIHLDGVDISNFAMHKRARLGIGYLPQEPSVFRNLTVSENLDIALFHSGLSKPLQRKRVNG